jgi:uncharacterized membrane protein
MIDKQESDGRDIERILANLLITCVIIAALVVLAGGVLYLLRHPGAPPDYRTFQGEPSDLRSVSGIFGNLFSLRSTGIIQFGLLLLLLTPVTWVAFLFFAFLRQRDHLYTAIALLVLAILLYSLAGGHFW